MQIQFNSRLFDPTTRLLSHQGRSIRLRPKTARLLSCLLERPHQLRRKDELIEAIWGHTQMDDQALHQIIRNLRQSVADPDCLITHPAEGYEWIWDIEHCDDPSTTVNASGRPRASLWRSAWRPLASVLLLTIALTASFQIRVAQESEGTERGMATVVSSVALTPQFARMQSILQSRQQGNESAALATLLDWQSMDSSNIELLIEIAHSHQQLGQLSMAQQAATDALSMAREQSSVAGEVLAGLVLSQMQYRQGLTADAIASVQQSGQLASEMGLACAIKLTEDWQLAIRNDWKPATMDNTMRQVASNMARCSLNLDDPSEKQG